ncbi:MAG: hypothetical protein H6564_04655 [Lewinellaceae bacterium]|nr:hypothetical protein [Lewinellaceae bacterium]
MSTTEQQPSLPLFSREWTGRIAVLLLMAALLALRFPDFFQYPNSRVIEPYGDGFKVYAVMEYHARWDSTLSRYEGMNYPYGEHVVPADAQPLLSNAIKLVSRYLVDVTGYTRAVLHFSLLLSFLLCAYFLYLILRKLETPIWWAVGVSIGLTFLSPQFPRLSSHYGLGQVAALPAIIYLLLRLEETKSWKTSAWIAATVTAFSLIHFYFYAIMAFFITFYYLFGFLRRPSLRRLFRYAFHYSIQLLAPLVFFYFWMYHGDPVTDRTPQPWGFFAYHAIWESIFTSLTQPYFQWINDQVIKFQHMDFEGRAYIGLAAGIGLLILLGRWFRHRLRQAVALAGGPFNGFLNKAFWASVVLLLFSFGYPFTIPGLEGLLDYAGPIRQFRSVGRFSWFFYYMINLVVFAELWRWVSKSSWRYVVGGLALLLLYFEAYNFCTAVDLRLDEVRELQPGQHYTDIEGVNYSDFQAILTVPYYNIGSDNLWFHGEGDIVPRSLTLSMQSGLPVTSAMLTRTSLSQTLKEAQLITEPYRLPRILSDFPNQKPLLLMVSNDKFEGQKDKYQHLLEGAHLLYETDAYRLFRLPLRTFGDRITTRVRDIQNDIAFDSLSLYPHGDFLSRDSFVDFYYNSLDSLPAEKSYRGGGGFQLPGGEKSVIYDGPLPRQSAGSYYILSFWMYLQADMAGRSFLEVEEYVPGTGEGAGWQAHQVYYNLRALDDNGWGLLEFRIVPNRADTNFRVKIHNPEMGKRPLWLDELMIRQEVSEAYRQGEGYVWKNNRWYPVGR